MMGSRFCRELLLVSRVVEDHGDDDGGYFLF